MNIIAFIKFFSDIVNLINGFKETPLEKHEELRNKIKDAFDEAKKGNPEPIVDFLNKR